MKPDSRHSYSNHTNKNSLWKWKDNIHPNKRNTENELPIISFLGENGQKLKENTLGPGIGAGVGCGAGLGFGLVGGFGFGGSPWNHLKVVFGVGMGCGVGFGLGYGQGIGGGISWEDLQDYLLSKKGSDKGKKKFVVDY